MMLTNLIFLYTDYVPIEVRFKFGWFYVGLFQIVSLINCLVLLKKSRDYLIISMRKCA